MAEPASPRPRARIVDVARQAAVSAQTVSNVINGRGGFTEETRKRVEAAIEDLGFQPNRYAQSLRSRRTMLLGFDMTLSQLDPTQPFTVTFLHALIGAASAHGYRVVTFTHERAEAEEFRASATAGAVDGFVLSDYSPHDRRGRILADAGIPFVVFGRTAPDLPQAWVDIDNRAAMVAMVDHLVSAGRRRFAYVTLPLVEYWDIDRHAGVRDRLAARNLPLSEDLTVFGSPESIRPALTRLLTSPHPPDAVITSSDSLAVVAVNLATSLGLHVGDELAVTGFDAGPFSRITVPPLTSVEIPVDHIADALVTRLMSELDGRSQAPGIVVPTRLALGGSG